VSHPRHRLDPVLHSPVRFSIAVALVAADRAEFAFVRDTVEVSDSVLSRQTTKLEAAGYLKVTKGYVGKRPRTWLSLTPEGRAAVTRHLAALEQLAAGVELSPEGRATPSAR
jgi:DNA-binding MarR family transcriptional regulator